MRLFTVLGAAMIMTAIYDVSGQELPWLKAIGAALLVTIACACDAMEKKDK